MQGVVSALRTWWQCALQVRTQTIYHVIFRLKTSFIIMTELWKQLETILNKYVGTQNGLKLEKCWNLICTAERLPCVCTRSHSILLQCSCPCITSVGMAYVLQFLPRQLDKAFHRVGIQDIFFFGGGGGIFEDSIDLCIIIYIMSCMASVYTCPSHARSRLEEVNFIIAKRCSARHLIMQHFSDCVCIYMYVHMSVTQQLLRGKYERCGQWSMRTWGALMLDTAVWALAVASERKKDNERQCNRESAKRLALRRDEYLWVKRKQRLDPRPPFLWDQAKAWLDGFNGNMPEIAGAAQGILLRSLRILNYCIILNSTILRILGGGGHQQLRGGKPSAPLPLLYARQCYVLYVQKQWLSFENNLRPSFLFGHVELVETRKKLELDFWYTLFNYSYIVQGRRSARTPLGSPCTASFADNLHIRSEHMSESNQLM